MTASFAENSAAPIYSAFGKRDPFKIPKYSPREPASESGEMFRYTLEQFQLKAILKGADRSQILVQDPKGKSYILNQGEVLGKGKAIVSRVLDTEVIFTEEGINYLGVPQLTEKVLSIPRESGDRE
jgi:Tfp pilus assembly protein PilP